MCSMAIDAHLKIVDGQAGDHGAAGAAIGHQHLGQKLAWAIERADVGHCRVNIASELGQQAADRFLELYRVVSGSTEDYHPYWDISAAIGGLDEDADDQPSPADEQFLAAAVVRL